MHWYWKSELLPGLSDEMLDVLRAQYEGPNARANQITLFQVEGALNEHAEDDGAVGNRHAAFACVVQAMSPDSQAAEANRQWVHSAWESLRRFSVATT